MELLYADKRIAVAVKPPGVLSTDEPGGMPELLRAQLGTPCIRTVHRLDAATGGVMVFARSAAAASILSGQVREHRFRKIYLAVVRGDPGQGGIWRDMLGRDPVRRVTYIAREPGKDVRPAELSYETLAVREGLSLVRVTLHTGRTHQIRVQFAGRGFPLVGDRKYGGAGDGETLALWAWRLAFTHPETGRDMCSPTSPRRPGPGPCSPCRKRENKAEKRSEHLAPGAFCRAFSLSGRPARLRCPRRCRWTAFESPGGRRPGPGSGRHTPPGGWRRSSARRDT